MVRDIGQALAAEMEGMSLNEQQQTMRDVLGTGGSSAEDPVIVDKALKELDTYIVDKLGASRCNRTPTSNERTALELALEQSSAYVRSAAFCKLILRASNWDYGVSKKSVETFFEYKRQLFGNDRLCRTITLQDLDDADLVALQSGYVQLLPERDRAGRSVIVCLDDFRYGHDFNSLVRSVKIHILSCVSWVARCIFAHARNMLPNWKGPYHCLH